MPSFHQQQRSPENNTDKLYSGEANPEHILHLVEASKWHHAAKGFLFHTGKASEDFRRAAALAENVDIVSGQKLIDFLLGRKGLYVYGAYQPKTRTQEVQPEMSEATLASPAAQMIA